MIAKLLTEHHLEFLSLNLGCRGSLSLHLSKCHIVGNHMQRLNYYYKEFHVLASLAIILLGKRGLVVLLIVLLIAYAPC